MKKILLLILSIILIVGGYILVQNKKETKKSVVKIGAILALTGPSASQGEAIRDGLLWKTQELEKEGKHFELIIEDSQSDPKVGVSAYQKLTKQNHVSIILSHLSSVSLALKPLAEKDHVLLWAYSAHPAITQNSQYIIRHAYTISYDAKGLDDVLQNDGRKKVGILYQQDEYGKSFFETLQKLLVSRNIEVVSESIDNKSSDYRTQITKLKSEQPDALVYIILGKGAGVAIKQSHELGISSQLYSSAGFIVSPEAALEAGATAKGIKYQTNEYDPRTDQVFITAYREKFKNDLNISTSLGYIDMELLSTVFTDSKINIESAIEKIKNMKEFRGKFERVVIEPSGDIIIPTVVKTWE